MSAPTALPPPVAALPDAPAFDIWWDDTGLCADVSLPWGVWPAMVEAVAVKPGDCWVCVLLPGAPGAPHWPARVWMLHTRQQLRAWLCAMRLQGYSTRVRHQ